MKCSCHSETVLQINCCLSSTRQVLADWLPGVSFTYVCTTENEEGSCDRELLFDICQTGFRQIVTFNCLFAQAIVREVELMRYEKNK